MTVFPEIPRLGDAEIIDGQEFRRLEEDHLTFIEFWFGWSLEVIVRKGYLTDGASVPKNIFSDPAKRKKVESLLDEYRFCGDWDSIYLWLVGTPWDMPRLLAAVVHDALYSLNWSIRFLVDRVYKKILEQSKYPLVRREVEYDLIRLFGGEHWDEVTEEEKIRAKRQVFVKWVKTKKIPKILDLYGKGNSPENS